MKKYTIQFVRHGISLANELNMIAGWKDVPLTDAGREELREVRETYNYLETERYYSSDLLRCRETFDILFAPEHEITAYLPSFREICFHEMDGHVFEDKDAYRAYFKDWVHDIQVKDEETLSPLKARGMLALSSFLDRMDRENFSTATIVSHSGFIRGLMCALLHFPNEKWNELTVPNGRGFVFTLYREGKEIEGVEIESIHHRESKTFSCALGE